MQVVLRILYFLFQIIWYSSIDWWDNITYHLSYDTLFKIKFEENFGMPINIQIIYIKS